MVCLPQLIAISPNAFTIEEVTQATEEFINPYSNIQSRSYPIGIVQEATNDFSENLIIGRGGYGNVYACTIDGIDVAVKRLTQDSSQGVLEFENEISFLSGLDHENVIKLVGYSVSPAEKIIIYEFMSNNSLASLLFDDTKRKRLAWSTRVKIIRGIANGLNYLHNEAAKNLIHRDIKAGNILLDNNMIAKIADFGTAKNANMLDNPSPPKGTTGYWDPHYYADGKLSRKSDVYSFGVIILEMLTGKKSILEDATSQSSHISSLRA
ncbi:phosphorylase kinase, gamma catalytic subunit [Artemisia annua]|uniref:non-specific serine/threonine protein kinase n=1 Tax=Artemisia annua TaxID=35608 RepID=A0A2U1LSN9_ARTAN|nr:phosphorylase kinase, gamma catalytic subunit [Artemisia annua]